ncbi:MAG TPA: hypothetical protein DCY00_05305 [Actinobacteria bacterium]|jgi:DNA-binding transcriptional ArsR family regulator|nr:hypothetical protein [Actinomycetota bacterium]
MVYHGSTPSKTKEIIMQILAEKEPLTFKEILEHPLNDNKKRATYYHLNKLRKLGKVECTLNEKYELHKLLYRRKND